MKLIYVEWTDAIANANWFDMDEAQRWAEISEWRVRDVGWLIKEDKNYLTIASSWKTEDEWTQEQVKLLHHIPKGMIKKKIDLTKHIKPKATKDSGGKQ